MTSRRINSEAVLGVLRHGTHSAREIATALQTSTALVQALLDTPAAGPRLAPNLQSTLAGYDREISRRVELAMSTRGK
ncbi:DNA-binding protein [Burkholderia cenocepacia]|uniref:DNA-binding protein n=1 Tax=Burkholderia cenocepacia TaxID=95486 RepID=A0A6B2MNU5_9BURK|nr:DNA-binding protein [Burkholderia cenocepacia]NDV77233.1 DNA-binding protein [Burkholderia cenocepacia]